MKLDLDRIYDLSFIYSQHWNFADSQVKEAFRILLGGGLAEPPFDPDVSEMAHDANSEVMSRREVQRVWQVLAVNPNTPPPVLAALARSGPEWLACEVADNPAADEATLKCLAHHPSASVRSVVACNPSTPRDVELELCSDDCIDVRYSVGESFHAPYAALRQLAVDENPYVADRARRTLDSRRSARGVKPIVSKVAELIHKLMHNGTAS